MLLKFIILCGFINVGLTAVTGPFIMWGKDNLKTNKMSALEHLNDKVLRSTYTEAAAIVLFVKDSNTTLSSENFPVFQKLLQSLDYTYLPQKWLLSDPFDYNVNAEIIHLVGPVSQQDVEISAIYNDAVSTYGDKVLGILATNSELEHIRKKREEETEPEEVPTPEETASEPGPNIRNLYRAIGKTMLYTEFAPYLSDNESKVELNNFDLVTSDVREQINRLIVTFKVNKTGELSKLTLRFRFPISTNGYWSLNAVEVEDSMGTKSLEVVGAAPTAPVGFSYKCARTLVFQNGSTILTLDNVQVQTLMDGKEKFGDAYDCIGFMSAPIWSGIFVTSIMAVIIIMALICIMEIKTPNKFENTRGKQLTFTVIE